MTRILVAAAILGGLLVIAAVATRLFVLRPYWIPGSSMAPNLDKDDLVVVLDRPFSHPPRRGDLVAFVLPTDGRTALIKRVIGMPGDRVQLRGGQLFVNEALAVETPLGPAVVSGDDPPAILERETDRDGRSYTVEIIPGSLGSDVDNTGVYVVPEHCYFVLGDNRDNSLDSRFDPGLPAGDPKLGGCGVDRSFLSLGGEPGIGFVPESHVVGIVGWNLTHPLQEQGSPW